MRARLMACLVAAVITVGGGMYLLTQPAPVSAATAECDFGELYECDPDQNYVYEGTCYTDDGCYVNLEPCC